MNKTKMQYYDVEIVSKGVENITFLLKEIATLIASLAGQYIFLVTILSIYWQEWWDTTAKE